MIEYSPILQQATVNTNPGIQNSTALTESPWMGIQESTVNIDPFGDVFGGDFSPAELRVEMEGLGLGEVVTFVSPEMREAAKSFKSDFEMVADFIKTNAMFVAEFRGMVVAKAAAQADACGGHSSNSVSASTTSSEVNFTSLSNFGKNDEDSEENHKHCGKCGSEYEGANCPNCVQ